MESIDEKLALLDQMREESRNGGGQDRIDSQHEKGKMTAHERLEYLFDDGTFVELDSFAEHDCHSFGMADRKKPGDAVVTGYGEIDGRGAVAFAHDFTVFGGSVSSVVADKINKLMDKAVENGVPVVGLNDSGGARIQEGVDSLAGFARLFRRNTKASGVVPQISAIMGPCAGGAVYSPAITDFTVMVNDTSHMFITGPDVIETVTGEQVSMEELGGAGPHSSKSGVAHFAYESDEGALDGIRELLSYLPANNMSDPPRLEPWDDPDRRDDELVHIVPNDPKKPYDVKDVVSRVVDTGSFFEVQEAFAKNMVVGFGRLDGRSVGIVANQPKVNAGTLNIDASEKAARFVRFCDSFNIPIVTFVDVPGFMPGTDQEHQGIIRRGAKLIYAYAEATVPLFTVILRKAYGGAYIVMASNDLGSDANYAWPHAEIAVMGPKGAVNILNRREITQAENPDQRREELIEEYREEFANPYKAAQNGHIDEVIRPRDTRHRLIRDLRFHESKRKEGPSKRHGNIPL
ncbi:acyl-CoA carboxylase subunit beta [Halobacteriaceae archaeon GCM10025711]